MGRADCAGLGVHSRERGILLYPRYSMLLLIELIAYASNGLRKPTFNKPWVPSPLLPISHNLDTFSLAKFLLQVRAAQETRQSRVTYLPDILLSHTSFSAMSTSYPSSTCATYGSVQRFVFAYSITLAQFSSIYILGWTFPSNSSPYSFASSFSAR